MRKRKRTGRRYPRSRPVSPGATNRQNWKDRTGRERTRPPPAHTLSRAPNCSVGARTTRSFSSEIIDAVRDFFNSRGFVLVDTPIFTPAAVEGTTTLFPVRYFEDETVYLTQSIELLNIHTSSVAACARE
jgi:hypothetical protein